MKRRFYVVLILVAWLAGCGPAHKPTPRLATHTPSREQPATAGVRFTPAFISPSPASPTQTQPAATAASAPAATHTPLPPTHTSPPTRSPAPTLVPMPQHAPYPVPTQGVLALTVENAAQIELLASLGKGRANDTSWSPDNRYLVIETSLGVNLYETTTWQQVKSLAQVSYVSWSPDNRFMVADSEIQAEGGGGITLYNGKTLEQLLFFAGGDEFLWFQDHWLVIYGEHWAALYNLETLKRVQLLDVEINFDWSPDEHWLIVYGTDSATVYRMPMFEMVKQIGSEGYLSWSVDGKWVADVKDGNIDIYELQNFTNAQHFDSGDAVVFSPDGKTLATQSTSIKLWDIANGQLGCTLDGNIETSQPYSPSLPRYTPYFNSTGSAIFLPTNLGDDFYFSLQMWNTATCNLIYTQEGYTSRIDGYDAAFSPDGTQAAVYVEAEILILDTQTGETRHTIRAGEPGSPITHMSYSLDGTQLITSAGIFEVSSGQSLNHQAYEDFQISPDGNILAGGVAKQGKPGSIQIWDLVNNRLLHTLLGSYNGMYPVSFSADSQFLAAFDDYGNIQIHHAVSGESLHQFEFDATIFDIAFGPASAQTSGDILAVSDEKGRIRLWDTGTHQALRTILGNVGQYNPVTISPGGQYLAYHARGGGVVQVVEIFTGQVLRNLTGADPWITTLAFSPDGSILAAGSDNYEPLVFWEVSSGQSLKREKEERLFYAFSPDGQQFAWGAFDRVKVGGIPTSKTVIELFNEELGPDEAYASIAYSHDGRLLAAGTTDGKIAIWDLAAQKSLCTLEGHEVVTVGHDSIPVQDVTDLAFSPYGYLLASTGDDDTLRLWDAGSCQPLRVLGHVYGPVRFSTDGSLLASISWDATVRLWGIPKR